MTTSPDLYLIQVNWYHYQRSDGRLTPRWREAAQFTREAAEREAQHERAAGAKAAIEVVSVASVAEAEPLIDAKGRLRELGLPTDDLVVRAYARAVKVHNGQFRKDGKTPYIRHVEAVMVRGSREPVRLAVKALHDSREPDAAHPLTNAEIVADFGSETADGVDTLTRREGESYPVFIERVCTHEDGKWRGEKQSDCLANLSDDPTDRQCRKYGAALLRLVPNNSVK